MNAVVQGFRRVEPEVWQFVEMLRFLSSPMAVTCVDATGKIQHMVGSWACSDDPPFRSIRAGGLANEHIHTDIHT